MQLENTLTSTEQGDTYCGQAHLLTVCEQGKHCGGALQQVLGNLYTSGGKAQEDLHQVSGKYHR